MGIRMHAKLFFSLGVLLLPFTALAAEGSHPAEHLAFGVGYFDILHDDGAALLDLEYRGDYVWEDLRPVLGVSLDSNGGIYAHGGVHWDFSLDPNWILSPNFMVGAYSDGGSKDLGHALEFRSGLELSYRFDDASRLGLAFNHISNASIGDKNPGAESLLLVYSHPIFGWKE